jgi:hypothetical protein
MEVVLAKRYEYPVAGSYKTPEKENRYQRRQGTLVVVPGFGGLHLSHILLKI